jgi:Tol biopolymer transport system component
LWSAFAHQRSREREPASHFQPVLLQPSSIYASRPAVSSAGIVFESMGAGGYVLSRTMGFDGHAFHPAVPASGSPIFFELVSRGHSRIMSFEPRTKVLSALTPEALNATHPAVTASGDRLAFIAGGTLRILGQGELATPRPVEEAAWFPLGRHLAISARGAVYDSADGKPLAPGIPGEQGEPAVSPDGMRLALTVTRRGIRHVWVEELSTKAARELTGGDCNSYAPAWEADSGGLIFASDCGRGLGLPRLYRAPLR